MAITANLVKEIRQRTGAGMMDCKKALVQTNGDIEKAIENMRKSGQAKAAKKAGRIAAEGSIFIAVNENNTNAAIIELNCETDFVSKDAGFLSLGNKIAQKALTSKTQNLEDLENQTLEENSVKETITALVAKIGENIKLRRLNFIKGDFLAHYLHGAKIGVVTSLDINNPEVAKDICLHVAATNPAFISPKDVSKDVLEKEEQIQLDIAKKSGKPEEIAKKMVIGRMNKFSAEISLTGQAFVKDPTITVEKLLKEKKANVMQFVRFEVGEGIEKKEVDFAKEVEDLAKTSS